MGGDTANQRLGRCFFDTCHYQHTISCRLFNSPKHLVCVLDYVCCGLAQIPDVN
jgi:hypothetical protein